MPNHIPKRYSILFLSLVLTAAGCTGANEAEITSTTGSALAGPSTSDPVPSDTELIIGLWQRQTASWAAGFDAGVEFWVENNYPPMGCTFADYISSRFPIGPVEGLIIERIVDPGSVEPDDGWKIPGGSLEGEIADGRVYQVTVESRRYEAGQPTPEPESLELHVTILDGQPYFFLGC